MGDTQDLYSGVLKKDAAGLAIRYASNSPNIWVHAKFYNDIPQLIEILAHELFHCVQYQYGEARSSVQVEGTATAMEDVIFSNTSGFVGPAPFFYEYWYARSPNILDREKLHAMLPGSFPYTTSIFWTYLMEHAHSNGRLEVDPTKKAAVMEDLWRNSISQETVEALLTTVPEPEFYRFFGDFAMALRRRSNEDFWKAALIVDPNEMGINFLSFERNPQHLRHGRLQNVNFLGPFSAIHALDIELSSLPKQDYIFQLTAFNSSPLELRTLIRDRTDSVIQVQKSNLPLSTGMRSAFLRLNDVGRGTGMGTIEFIVVNPHKSFIEPFSLDYYVDPNFVEYVTVYIDGFRVYGAGWEDSLDVKGNLIKRKKVIDVQERLFKKNYVGKRGEIRIDFNKPLTKEARVYINDTLIEGSPTDNVLLESWEGDFIFPETNGEYQLSIQTNDRYGDGLDPLPKTVAMLNVGRLQSSFTGFERESEIQTDTVLSPEDDQVPYGGRDFNHTIQVKPEEERPSSQYKGILHFCIGSFYLHGISRNVGMVTLLELEPPVSRAQGIYSEITLNSNQASQTRWAECIEPPNEHTFGRSDIFTDLIRYSNRTDTYRCNLREPRMTGIPQGYNFDPNRGMPASGKIYKIGLWAKDKYLASDNDYLAASKTEISFSISEYGWVGKNKPPRANSLLDKHCDESLDLWEHHPILFEDNILKSTK
ncbi:MAG: hypothetical protein HY390_02735 [Deltaproteobacteria bacterium]|nr:hypothetical protein [Deltaproteobacteria bacterium]